MKTDLKWAEKMQKVPEIEKSRGILLYIHTCILLTVVLANSGLINTYIEI